MTLRKCENHWKRIAHIHDTYTMYYARTTAIWYLVSQNSAKIYFWWAYEKLQAPSVVCNGNMPIKCGMDSASQPRTLNMVHGYESGEFSSVPPLNSHRVMSFFQYSVHSYVINGSFWALFYWEVNSCCPLLCERELWPPTVCLSRTCSARTHTRAKTVSILASLYFEVYTVHTELLYAAMWWQMSPMGARSIHV